MRAKFVSVFILIFIVFLAVLIWRVDQLIFEDKLTWNEAQSRAQISAVVRALESEQKSLRESLALGFPIVAEKNRDYSEKAPYAKFQMMAELTPPTAADKKDWKLGRKFFVEKTDVRAWADQYLTLAMNSISANQVPPNGGLFLTILNPKRVPHLLLISRTGSGAEEQWLLGIGKLESLQGIADRQKGQMSQVFVVNSRGEALGHTIPEYVGSQLSEDPLVSEMTKANMPSGSGLFTDLKGDQVQGFYEQIQNTNLFAVVSTPMATLVESRQSTWIQFALLGLGMCFVGVALFLLSVRDETPRPQRVVVSPSAGSNMPGMNAGAGIHALPPMPSMTEDKMSIYTKVAAALSHELSGPITAALGHTQIAKIAVNKVNPMAAQKVETIEDDLRAAREILQKLLIFAGEDKYKESIQSLDSVVAKVLKNMESKMITKGIKLSKNLMQTPAFNMSQELVMKAIENVLQNSIEAMDRVPKKEISVEMERAGDKIIVVISDTGEGIDATDLEKVFDPFFTRRSHAKHSGLGLSATLGILSAMKGDVKITSEKGKGTVVKLVFNSAWSNELSDTPDLNSSPSLKVGEGSLPPPPSPLLEPIASTTGVREGSLSIQLQPLTTKAPSQNSGIIKLEQTNSKINIAAPESETSPKEAKNTADPFLSDNSLENLIEGGPDAVEDISEKTVASASDIPAMLPNEDSSGSGAAPATSAAQGKIDRPKMKPRKSSALTEEVMVSVRKPGEKA